MFIILFPLLAFFHVLAGNAFSEVGRQGTPLPPIMEIEIPGVFEVIPEEIHKESIPSQPRPTYCCPCNRCTEDICTCCDCIPFPDSIFLEYIEKDPVPVAIFKTQDGNTIEVHVTDKALRPKFKSLKKGQRGNLRAGVPGLAEAFTGLRNFFQQKSCDSKSK